MVMMMMMFQLRPHIHILQYQYYHPTTTPKSAYNINNISKCRRREAAALSLSLSLLLFPSSSSSSSSSSAVASTSASKSSSSSSSELLFLDIPNSGGVKVLDLRVGSGDVPLHGNQVAIHYYGRLAAKQGWRFDSTYDHKDENGESVPFVFVLGSGKSKVTWHSRLSRPTVISGIEAAVKSMKVGGIRRVIIPPSQGYQNTSQEPIPPNFFDRQRLFTTIFNPTRLANGEGSTLGTLIFDIELVSVRHQ
ncbi:peptidyl-prolyl cis-trans isomerase FKBP17-1, chloroplastic isoform X1 [Quercus robur]|uniref:peptidyl-prolyl cis-trans isomerase FKBP17-1, chloroplastic isoform X1 n=1 Tax=Quercus robur TaxID=38942 RepID=UPI0021616378|nr:peptidyl-prolyl cis-trans isomerase FKBP17-1, chloroplastic isoform X1 [Quercus robur]